MRNIWAQYQTTLMIHGVILTAGLYHNYIKPSNILLATEYADSEIKVADFGLARDVTYCESGECRGYGTKGYWAPEVEQYQWHSHLSEMYSIGAVFYFMVCGEDHFWFENGKIWSNRPTVTTTATLRVTITVVCHDLCKPSL